MDTNFELIFKPFVLTLNLSVTFFIRSSRDLLTLNSQKVYPFEMFQSTKKPGDLSSAFASSEGFVWPQKFKHLKDSINPQNVEASWKRLLEAFQAETEKIMSQGPSIVPQVDFKDIQANNGKFPADRLAELKHHGVVVIRNVIDPETALRYKKDVQDYIDRNRDKIIGFPLTFFIRSSRDLLTLNSQKVYPFEMFQSTKKPGDLSSAFASSEGFVWPQKFKHLKDSINPQNVEASWKRLLEAFQAETEKIMSQGPSIVPQVDFKDIQANNGKFPADRLAELKHHGVVVIRNVIDPETALRYKKDVQDYIDRNRDKIIGFPQTNPQVWEVYWSKSQFEARSHPNFNMAVTAVNQLWHADEGTVIDLATPIAYCDRLRIRQPGDKSFTLAEHVDGGSVERWEDPEYRRCYENILNGNWELHDAFDATHRVDANADLYNCSGGCSMFRSFQGWMSLSDVAPGGGTLRVCPLIKLTTAYIILRPFLSDLRNTSNMSGAVPSAQQNIPGDLFPHIVAAMTSIPKVSPGDCVFWHCDMVHAVEGSCGNPTDSSVFYIPATPLCRKNVEYLARQKYAFENGTSAPDFPLNNCEATLCDRAHKNELSDLGQSLMGFKKFPHDGLDTNAKLAAEVANQIIFGAEG